MNSLNKILLTASVLVGSVLSAQSLPEIINDKNTVLVDVRTPEEFEEKTANNAINIPINEMENNWQQLKGKKNIVVFCKSGKRAGKAEEFLKSHGLKVYNAKTMDDVRALQKTNILDKISFYPDKPSIRVIKKEKNMKMVAVGLGKGAKLDKHTTSDPALLVVLKGKIDFIINGQTIRLNEMDTYDIPVDVEHEVIGINNENIFTLAKGTW